MTACNAIREKGPRAETGKACSRRQPNGVPQSEGEARMLARSPSCATITNLGGSCRCGAVWQRRRFVIVRSWVRIPPPAPKRCKRSAHPYRNSFGRSLEQFLELLDSFRCGALIMVDTPVRSTMVKRHCTKTSTRCAVSTERPGVNPSPAVVMVTLKLDSLTSTERRRAATASARRRLHRRSLELEPMSPE